MTKHHPEEAVLTVQVSRSVTGSITLDVSQARPDQAIPGADLIAVRNALAGLLTRMATQ